MKKRRNIIIIGILVLIGIAFATYKIYATTYISKETWQLQSNSVPVMKRATVVLEEMSKEPIVLNVTKEETEESKIAKARIKTKTYEGQEVIAILKVPSIDIEYPVLAETSDELMEITLNKFWGGEPNEVGNFCIIGHNYKSGKHFGKLKYVNKGDTVLLTDNSNRTVTYQVYDTYTIDPYDTKCTSQLTNGKREVTLITCTNGGKNRLIVKAREVQ